MISLQMITSTFLFSYWEKKIQSEILSSEIKKSRQIISSNAFSIICNRSSTNESRFCQSIKFVYFSFRVRWRVQLNTYSDLYIENFNSSIVLFFYFLFSLRLLICLICFFCFAWIIHEWQIWLHSKHLSFIFSRFDKLIYYYNLWIKIRNYQRWSDLLLLTSKFLEILRDFSNISLKRILFRQIEHWINDRLTLQFERWRERLQISSNDWRNEEKSLNSLDHHQ